jgi:hypothetical protein
MNHAMLDHSKPNYSKSKYSKPNYSKSKYSKPQVLSFRAEREISLRV